MEEIKYKEKMLHCSTPCPHGMKATERYTKKPFVVHVGCLIEEQCPFFVERKREQRKVVCDFIPDTFDIYHYNDGHPFPGQKQMDKAT